MIRQDFYVGHIARMQNFLSSILKAQNKTVEGNKMREDALKTGQALNGSDWKPEKGQQDYDDLVFFHDRWPVGLSPSGFHANLAIETFTTDVLAVLYLGRYLRAGTQILVQKYCCSWDQYNLHLLTFTHWMPQIDGSFGIENTYVSHICLRSSSVLNYFHRSYIFLHMKEGRNRVRCCIVEIKVVYERWIEPFHSISTHCISNLDTWTSGKFFLSYFTLFFKCDRLYFVCVTYSFWA